jgi:hypothetical protein
MEQTVKTYKSLEEIYKYFLPSTTESQKQDHNDPETIWKSVEKEVLAKLKSKAQFDRK